MPLQIVRNDITRMNVDAIVNAANETLLGGGGVDGAIHRAAGPELLAYCRKLNGCRTGEAKITPGFNLPAKYVIHTVGPIWRGGNNSEAALLRSCYKNSLALAKEYKCESVAFPVISAGAYGYPKDQAFRIAVNAIQDFLSENDMTVYMVVFDSSVFLTSRKLFADVQQYIDQHYVDAHTDSAQERRRRQAALSVDYMPMPCAAPERTAPAETVPLWGSVSLEDALDRLDEGFSEMLLRKIDESGMTDVECYKKANIGRKLFSKIRSNRDYRPSKRTAVALCIALELDLTETRELLTKAGIALTHASKFDIIIEYFILNRKYDIFEINETLLGFDQPLLGV
ncbi:MAG: O-acetyl-ADP-ribose deacetylase [Clostridia bacterium]|nr:O-acetyl-ADP-ribose deacetylase [Clostridia bacterium]